MRKPMCRLIGLAVVGALSIGGMSAAHALTATVSVDGVLRATATTGTKSVSVKDNSDDGRWVQAQYTLSGSGGTVYAFNNKSGPGATATKTGLANNVNGLLACRSGALLGGMQCGAWS